MAWLTFAYAGVWAGRGMSLVFGTVARTGFLATTDGDVRTD
jgi:hypothetical protein